MQLNMPIPGEFTRLVSPETRIVSRSPEPVYVRRDETPVVVRSERIDPSPLARLKPADRHLYEEREMEFNGEPSIAQRKTRDADQELYIQRQDARIEDLEKTVKTLRKELSVARNNQRSFGTRSEDNEIARLKRRVAQLEYENRELRAGAYISIDEGIGQRGEIVLHDAHQPHLRVNERARRASATAKTTEPAKAQKTKSDKFAHVKPRVNNGKNRSNSPVNTSLHSSGEIVYRQPSPARIVYRDAAPMAIAKEYPRIAYSEPAWHEYGQNYSAPSYIAEPSYVSYSRPGERIIDETPRVYSASRILGPENVPLIVE